MYRLHVVDPVPSRILFGEESGLVNRNGIGNVFGCESLREMSSFVESGEIMEVPGESFAESRFALQTVDVGRSGFLPEDTREIHDPRRCNWKLNAGDESLYIAPYWNDRTRLATRTRSELQFDPRKGIARCRRYRLVVDEDAVLSDSTRGRS